MATVIEAERIGREGVLRIGAGAVIFDETRERILLTRRSDNGLWCLPSGAMEPGETIEETCVREVFEETCLQVRIVRMIGIYSSPHRLITYADGNRWQVVGISFEAEVISGEMGLSDETTEIGYFTRAEMDSLPMMKHHLERIDDAWKQQTAAFFR
jgi:ADP-ribose pyrophosphatase YjhB (NUDIX family)